MELTNEACAWNPFLAKSSASCGLWRTRSRSPYRKTPNPVLVVRADSVRFKQVLMNLLGNAIKFTPKDGSIELGAHLAGGRVRVEVRDNGRASSRRTETHLRSLLSPSRIRQENEGTGLGLAITHRLVELHGGELTLDSELGKEVASISLSVAVAIQDTLPSATAGRDTRPLGACSRH